MLYVPSIVGAPRTATRDRLIGAGSVLFIHVLLIGLLLTNNQQIVRSLPKAREIILTFAPARIEKHQPPPPKTATRPHSAQQPSWRLPTLPPVMSIPVPDAKGLDLPLFGCGPENLSNLSPEQRAHCSNLPTEQAFESPALGTVMEQSQYARHWAATVRARRTPVRVPCVSLGTMVTNGITGATATTIMVDFVCTAKLLRPKTHGLNDPE